ncbi:MAG TPA: gluconokinase [Sphingobacteriaceae bacterium]
MEKFFLGIDIGTGSVKAVATDGSGRSLAGASVPYPTLSPSPGYSEQDPVVVWESFVRCVKEVLSRVDGEPAAVSLSSAMHSLLPVDQECRPLMNAMTWADGRASEIAAALRAMPNGEDLYRATGTPVHSISMLARILWLREHEPVLYATAHKFISLKEFIWYRLFGAWEVDYSVASATGLFHITHAAWDATALALGAIEPFRLSDPVPTTYRRSDLVAEAQALLGLRPGTVFVIGASDGCLANLGTLAVDHRTAAITIGTSGAVRISSPLPVYNFGAMTFNYILDEDHYICGGPVNNGGLSLDWLVRNFLGYQEQVTPQWYEQLFARISGVPAGAEGLVFLPYLTGERAPAWDARASGAFFGVRLYHHQDHFLRAVLEGVCFALKQVLEIVEETTRPVEQIRLSGGFTGSPVWMQILADILQKPVCLVRTADASALGAVYLAMQALNPATDLSALHREPEHLVSPDPDKAGVYHRNFEIYKQLYPNLKPLMHF